MRHHPGRRPALRHPRRSSTTGPGSFSPDDVNFLQAVANVLAAAVQRDRDEQDLAAIRDELASQLADMTRLHALGAPLLEQPRAAEGPPVKSSRRSPSSRARAVAS